MMMIQCRTIYMAGSILFFTAAAAFPQFLQTPPDLEKLIIQLKQGDTKQKRNAAYQLSRLGPEAASAVPALIGALKASRQDPQIWFHSITSIDRIGPAAAEAIPVLLRELDNRSSQKWYRTARALGSIGPAALPDLIRILDDDNRRERTGAAKAIGWMGPEAGDAVAALIRILDDSEEQVRNESREALGRIGESALSELKHSLWHRNNLVRIGTAYALGYMGRDANSSSPEMLNLLLTESAPEVRATVITALTRTGTEPVKWVALLLTELQNPDELVFNSVVNAFLKLSPPETVSVPSLTELILSPDHSLSGRAAYILGRIGPSAIEAAPALLQAINRGPRLESSKVYRESLVQIGERAVPELLTEVDRKSLRSQEDLQWIVECLIQIGRPAVDRLAALLPNSSKRARLCILDSLTGIGPAAEAATPDLYLMAKDPDEEIRASAISTLSHLQVPIPGFIKLLDTSMTDGSANVRSASAHAIASLEEDAEPLLNRLLDSMNDPNSDVRLQVIRALGSIGEKAEKAVSELQSQLDPDFAIQLEIVRSLGKLGNISASAVPGISALLQGENIQLLALESLGRIGADAKEAMPEIIKKLEHSDPVIRAQAIQSLDAVCDDHTLLFSYLREGLNDTSPWVRQAACGALSKLGTDASEAFPKLFALLDSDLDWRKSLEALRRLNPKSTHHLIQALENKETSVRLFACEVLGRMGNTASDAIPALKERAQKDDYPFVRRQARNAIDRIQKKP
jgi:HEAT repeat protein